MGLSAAASSDSFSWQCASFSFRWLLLLWGPSSRRGPTTSHQGQRAQWGGTHQNTVVGKRTHLRAQSPSKAPVAGPPSSSPRNHQQHPDVSDQDPVPSLWGQVLPRATHVATRAKRRAVLWLEGQQGLWRQAPSSGTEQGRPRDDVG